eukprot:g6523.t1
MAAHSGGPFDMTVDPEALMKSLIERRAGKGKYRQSISKSLFDLLPKMKDVQEFHNFLLNPLNRDGMDVIHRQNRNGVTPLMLAASYGQLEIMESLLEKGAKITDRDNAGRTTLMWAARCNCYEAVEMILQFQKGETLEDKNMHGMTAFDEAFHRKQEECMALLMFYGCSITRDPRNYSIAWSIETDAREMLLKASGNRLDPNLLYAVGKMVLTRLPLFSG